VETGFPQIARQINAIMLSLRRAINLRAGTGLSAPLLVLIWDGKRGAMPKSIAQLTGVIVCAIVAFGTDLDVTYAMPLGVAAGALAIFFVSLMETRERGKLVVRSVSRQRAEWN
jgi:hypothetical protein